MFLLVNSSSTSNKQKILLRSNHDTGDTIPHIAVALVGPAICPFIYGYTDIQTLILQRNEGNNNAQQSTGEAREP